MKICPVCNDSFADELNFCDVDGVRLSREDSPQERNKWWSMLGAGLLVGALVITAASIIFLPKARVSPPVTSEAPPAAASPKEPSVTTPADVAAQPPQVASAEPETPSADQLALESRKKDKSVANANAGDAAPNPKAAALAAEGVEKGSPSSDAKDAAHTSAKPPEPAPAEKSVVELRTTEAPAKPAHTAVESKKEHQTPPTAAKTSEKNAADKKKNAEKDKNKGGFLRVFKKIFGKD